MPELTTRPVIGCSKTTVMIRPTQTRTINTRPRSTRRRGGIAPLRRKKLRQTSRSTRIDTHHAADTLNTTPEALRSEIAVSTFLTPTQTWIVSK